MTTMDDLIAELMFDEMLSEYEVLKVWHILDEPIPDSVKARLLKPLQPGGISTFPSTTQKEDCKKDCKEEGH